MKAFVQISELLPLYALFRASMLLRPLGDLQMGEPINQTFTVNITGSSLMCELLPSSMYVRSTLVPFECFRALISCFSISTVNNHKKLGNITQNKNKTNVTKCLRNFQAAPNLLVCVK